MYVHADNISTCNVEQSNYIKENPKTVSVHYWVPSPPRWYKIASRRKAGAC